MLIEPLERRLFLAYFDGTTANLSDYSASRGGEIVNGSATVLWRRLQTLNTPHLRVFHTLHDLSGTGNDFGSAEVGYLKYLSKKGIKITVMITPFERNGDPRSIPASSITYAATSQYFLGLFSKYPAIGRYVDRWQIGNEINLGKYFPNAATSDINHVADTPIESDFIRFTVPKFVLDFQKPAWDVLKAKGETVVGGSVLTSGFSGKRNVFNALETTPVHYINLAGHTVTAHYSNFCDIVSVQLFAPSARLDISDLKHVFASIKSVEPAGKPVSVTEWAIQDPHRDSASDPTIIADQNRIQAFMKANCDSAYFYRIRRRTTDVWHNQALFASDFASPNGPQGNDFVSMFLKWRAGDPA